MKYLILSLLFIFSIAISFVVQADTLHNKTITGIFTNKGTLVAFTFAPVESVSNPNNCDLGYLQLDSTALFFKEQYSTLMTAMITGAKVDINTSTTCGYNLIIDWLYIHP